jgi:hypothetical protein
MTTYRSKSKYGAKKVVRDGKTFDSQIEHKRYCELLLLQRAGAIHDLKRQVEFELIPAQYTDIPTGDLYKRGERKGQPKYKRVCIEQSVKYVADFVYRTNTNRVIVEDTKGVKTKDYIIKRKLMLWVHGIRINEVTK